MRHLLGTVSKGREVAEQRAESLRKAYPDQEFEVVDHDTRHQVVLVSGTPLTDQTVIERMTRLAQGIEPQHGEQADLSDPRATDTGRAAGTMSDATGGPSPNTAR